MQSCDRQRVFFFHPLKLEDRRVTDLCQEEEPHRHKPARKDEGQQQQQKKSRAVVEMAFLCPVSSESHCSEDFPAC